MCSRVCTKEGRGAGNHLTSQPRRTTGGLSTQDRRLMQLALRDRFDTKRQVGD